MRRRPPVSTPDNVTPELIPDAEFKDHKELLASDWTTQSVRPATIIAALMHQAPGDAYNESSEDTAALDDAVAYAFECLSAEDIFILNSVAHEGLTHTELGARLGVSRSQAWRLHQRAMDRLRVFLLNHPPVRERLGLPPTWDAAAMAELIEIASYEEDWPDDTPPYVTRDAVYDITFEVDRAAICTFDFERELDAVNALTEAARFAVAHLRSIGMWSVVGLHALLVSKQHDYGHKNITKFGVLGIVVRCSDKAERMKNLTKKSDTHLGGVAPANESLLDSFRDVVGYAVIARMLKAESFEYQLDQTEMRAA